MDNVCVPVHSFSHPTRISADVSQNQWLLVRMPKGKESLRQPHRNVMVAGWTDRSVGLTPACIASLIHLPCFRSWRQVADISSSESTIEGKCNICNAITAGITAGCITFRRCAVAIACEAKVLPVASLYQLGRMKCGKILIFYLFPYPLQHLSFLLPIQKLSRYPHLKGDALSMTRLMGTDWRIVSTPVDKRLGNGTWRRGKLLLTYRRLEDVKQIIFLSLSHRRFYKFFFIHLVGFFQRGAFFLWGFFNGPLLVTSIASASVHRFTWGSFLPSCCHHLCSSHIHLSRSHLRRWFFFLHICVCVREWGRNLKPLKTRHRPLNACMCAFPRKKSNNKAAFIDGEVFMSWMIFHFITRYFGIEREAKSLSHTYTQPPPNTKFCPRTRMPLGLQLE